MLYEVITRKQKSPEGILITYSSDEQFLLDYLGKNSTISQSAFCRKAKITYRMAEKILSDFIVLGILKPVFSPNKILFAIADDFDRNEWDKKNVG